MSADRPIQDVDPAAIDPARPALVHVTAHQVCCDDPWEAAYLRFETPEQEIQKFQTRLLRLGARDWPRDARIVELFCGRGNGLRALDRLGFREVEGVDLSATLLARYDGPSRCYVADCRELPFEDRSKDIVIIQGGLHHLPDLPADLERTLDEIRRVLGDEGRVVIVEPWLTPFLAFVHAVCDRRLARRLVAKVDALATMIEHERTTYEAWLGQPRVIMDAMTRRFDPIVSKQSWGKLQYVGRGRRG
ncbi:class I SAM-dependent methyltransferase [Singulisphaera acidiphila]|uniref:Methylase involved in ubiquinone/menaquinone biosynthesis n=1 Tax=Singulisphaera acidiphila (strain ATCC BAA-1392 / DSM 18658 / VKM B-2454 / MOB10) TaxID=886293 RepID=L0DFV6_SINAD|nr:class I SAM-dependent methyltransferase [Singulisphaera acidiphila]AGA28142.1 methylase involved in ubiquinone/menaquinone biosynthesis [Singulisphaera acidiphila DSM 18658]